VPLHRSITDSDSLDTLASQTTIEQSPNWRRQRRQLKAGPSTALAALAPVGM